MRNKTTYKIVLYYFLFGALWIFLSDFILNSLVTDIFTLGTTQTIKGIFFVILSSLYIYFLVRKFVTAEINETTKENLNALVDIKTELEDSENIRLQLEESQSNLNSLIESMSQAFILFDKDYKVILFNKTAANYTRKITGLELKKGISFVENIPEKFRSPYIHYFNRILNEETFNSERNFIIDGNKIWVDFIYHPAYNLKGEISGVVFTGIDITDRVNTMNKLKKSLSLYEDLIKATPDAVAIINEDGTINYISPYTIELLKIKDSVNIPGSTFFKWFAREEHLRVKEIMNKIINDKVSTKGNVYRMVREDGSTFYAEFNSSPINHDGEGNGSFITTFRDITDKIESRNRLLEYSNELKELNASKDKLFSIIAHDLRNPLQGLLGFSSLLNENFSDLSKEEVKEYIGYIYQSSKKMHSLTNNLLHWSRIKTGKVEFNPENFKLKAKVKQTLELLKPSIMKKNILVEARIDDKIFVFADVQMFDSIIQNLLTNAIKFSYDSGKIEIFTKQTNDNFVQINVKDYGEGIKQENFDKLFSITTHFTTQGTAKEEGTGLGLILFKELVEKCGGKISFESKYKKGSTFKFTLPINHTKIKTESKSDIKI